MSDIWRYIVNASQFDVMRDGYHLKLTILLNISPRQELANNGVKKFSRYKLSQRPKMVDDFAFIDFGNDC